MGTGKAALEWHGSTLLRRSLGVLRRAVGGPLLVVRAPGQSLPGTPPQVRVVDDPAEGLGPMQGIAAGLAALTGPIRPTGETAAPNGAADRRVEAAFVCSTDLPFLHPAFIRRVLAALTDDVDAVLPIARGYPQPLAAAYRTSLAPLVADLVAAGDLRLASLFGHPRCRTLRLDDAALLADPELAALDPALDSVVNVNSPDDYRIARQRPAPYITVQCHGTLADHRPRAARSIRAATLSAAAAAVDLTVDRHVVVVLNGDQLSQAGDIPLTSGDVVVFRTVNGAEEGPARP